MVLMPLQKRVLLDCNLRGRLMDPCDSGEFLPLELPLREQVVIEWRFNLGPVLEVGLDWVRHVDLLDKLPLTRLVKLGVVVCVEVVLPADFVSRQWYLFLVVRKGHWHVELRLDRKVLRARLVERVNKLVWCLIKLFLDSFSGIKFFIKLRVNGNLMQLYLILVGVEAARLALKVVFDQWLKVAALIEVPCAWWFIWWRCKIIFIVNQSLHHAFRTLVVYLLGGYLRILLQEIIYRDLWSTHPERRVDDELRGTWRGLARREL